MASKPDVEGCKLFYPRDLCDPKRWLNFVQLDPFPPDWRDLGLDDDDLRALEIAIMVDPERAPVVAGTGGLRKIRFAPPAWARGKSGATRVCYVYFREFGLVALVCAYGKSAKENLTEQEKRQIKGLILQIKRYLEHRGAKKGGARGR